jgi:fatty-acyl-CoA synthase
MLRHPARPDYNLSSLRGGTCGGADANPAILEECASAFPVPGLAQVYGQTEAATLLAAPHFDDPERFSTCGPPLPGFEVRIADPATGKSLQLGEIGEVQGRGDMVMLGYHNRPEATAETITPEGWLRTGDLGYLTPSGKLVIAGGRLRDVIIRGAENIYPAEIENLLQTHPAVAAVAVFGVPDDYYGEAVAAAVWLGGDVSADELKAFVAERIARFKVPTVIYRTCELPQTSSGKVRKVELKAWAKAARMELLP